MANRRALRAEADWAKEHSAPMVVSEAVRGHDQKISKFIQGSDALVQAIGPLAPKTLSQYCTLIHGGINAVNDLKFDVPRINGPYMVPWTARGILKDLMFAADVSELVVDKDITMDQFVSANPDQKDQLKLFQTALRNSGQAPKSVKEFIAAIGATNAGPELLSMYACFVVDDGVTDKDLEILDETEWDMCAARLEREWGLPPHLAMVAHAACHL